ncbi:MAG: DCC1-like thiol-disulfide oxidoreductase family protein [Candidatus Thermoplasmatota archaeon]|jgi:predicted DCC family thiol-disulfide oxidoreductase YuxK
MKRPPATAPAIVLYDGACGMCSENARKGRLYQRPGALAWVDNSSNEGQALLRRRGLLGKEQDSLIVLEGDQAYLDSDAAVRSAQGLRWPWRAYAGIRFLPKAMRNAMYRRIAAQRSRHVECRLPIPNDRTAEPAESRGH